MKKYLLLPLLALISCHHHEHITTAAPVQDSAELERKIKIIDFATAMAIEKAKQGYDSIYLERYRDSILEANNVSAAK